MLSLIAAMTKNRVIGRDNQLPWHLPEDLRYFKNTTLGKPIIMGRKTRDSLGRPLPGRRNIVVTHNPDYVAEGCEVVTSLPRALQMTANEPETFVIGGAQLYAQAIAWADRLYLTEIAAEFSGDAFFPELLPAAWEEVSRTPGVSESGLMFAFVVYHRRR